MYDPNPASSVWLTVEQLADRLAVPVSCLRYWRRCGIGPRAALLGRHLRWNLADVIAWETSRREAASPT